MSKTTRYLLIGWGIFGLVLAGAYYVQWSPLQELWPWSGGYMNSGDLSRFSFYFVSSIIAATALPTLWIGFSGEAAAIKAGAIDLTVMWGGIAIYMLQSYASSDNNRLLIGGLVCAGMCALSVVAFLGSRRFKFQDPRPMPAPVRAAFAFFAVALILVATMLVLKRENTFPWPLRDEVSVVYGWVFFGAAIYFIGGVLVPKWSNAVGQLLGFLIYDLILIVPFVQHFDVVRDDHRTSLITYTVVLVCSGLLAIYYLFINPKTRLWRATLSEAPTQPAVS